MRACACAALDAIVGHAASSPESPALMEPDGILLTYKELWARIETLGMRLRDAGVGPRQTVAILMHQGAPQVVAVAGVLNHCACAPLQPKTTVAEVESSLRMLSASALIVSPQFEAEAEAACAMGLTVLLAGDAQSPMDWKIHPPVLPLAVRTPPSEANLLLITSATTGSAKLVPLSAGNLDAGIASRRDALQLSSSDRVLLMTSLCHIIGIENAFAQFLVGGAVIATSGFDPMAYLGWLQNLRPTWYDCAPAVHQAALMQLKREQSYGYTFLRFVQSAGASLPDDARRELEDILRVPVFNDYGMTEACPIAVDAFLPGGRVPHSAGRSCGLEIGIMDSLGGLLSPDQEGEIVVRGPAVFSGYANNLEANRLAFQDGWFRTGDAGHLDTEGNLFITGRLKEMINRGGEKILPSEVDAALVAHPVVCEAAAFAIPHPTLGEEVACAVVLRTADEPPVGASELRRFAAQRLAAFKVPHRIFFVDQIPRGELGKPQRWLLAEHLSGCRADPPLPADVTQRRLVDDVDDVFYKLHEIWARILDRDDLGFDEDFFDAGGDSLTAVNMLAEVDQRFGSQTSASAASFLDEPTLARLTGLVGKVNLARSSQNASSELRVFPVRAAGTPRQLFCVPADEEEGLYFRRLATYLSGQMDLSIVRPANTLHSRALFTLERAGEEMAALVGQAQPEGPYLLGGYCYGGVVAAEAARLLALEGQDARLILFDAPMPGSPSFPHLCRICAESARQRWHRRRRGGQPQEPENVRHIGQTEPRPEVSSTGIARRVLWSTLVPARRLFVPFAHFRAVQRILRWAQYDYFPFYKARPIDAPILHFLCTDEPRRIDSASRLGWRKVARRGLEEQFVAHDHSNLLHESNLPTIVDASLHWCGDEIACPAGTKRG